MIKLALLGSSGKMGREISALINEADNFKLICALNSKDKDFSPLFQSDVIIDFSSPTSTLKMLEAAKLDGGSSAILIGTTGLDCGSYLQALVPNRALLKSANTSLGIAVLRRLVREAAKLLPGFDIEITELHHKHKKDAPSGTALSLFDAAKDAKKGSCSIYARAEQRKDYEIGLSSLRGGDAFGRHCVGLYGPGEYLELTHNATSRTLFAKGALACASFLHAQKSAQKPGLYTMDDVLN